MDSNTDKVDGASGTTSFADRGGDTGGGSGNVPVASQRADAAGERDPLAYRNAGDNARRRAEFMERQIIDAFFAGDVRRFDDAAGVDFNAV
jgi:hypothetical protein